MRIINLTTGPEHNFVNPTLRLGFNIEHSRDKEVILHVDGWIKSDEDRVIAHLNEYLSADEQSFDLSGSGSFYDRNNSLTNHYMVMVAQLNEKALKYIEAQRTKNKKKDVILKLELNISYLQSRVKISHVHYLDSVDNPNYKIMAYSFEREYSTSSNNGWILSGDAGPTFLTSKHYKLRHSLTIPSSDWINDFAPVFGLGNFSIIEIPTGSETISGAWDLVMKADVAYQNWDTKSVYAHCRECGSHLDKKMEEKFGKNTYNYDERWGRNYKRFNTLASLNLHLEEKKNSYSDECVEINKPDAEHLIIITKALINLAQHLLS